MQKVLELLAQHNIEGGYDYPCPNCHMKGKARDFIELLAHCKEDDEIEICGWGGNDDGYDMFGLSVFINGERVCSWVND